MISWIGRDVSFNKTSACLTGCRLALLKLRCRKISAVFSALGLSSPLSRAFLTASCHWALSFTLSLRRLLTVTVDATLSSYRNLRRLKVLSTVAVEYSSFGVKPAASSNVRLYLSAIRFAAASAFARSPWNLLLFASSSRFLNLVFSIFVRPWGMELLRYD